MGRRIIGQGRMIVSFDPEKRDAILAQRGLDLRRGIEVFDGTVLTIEDDRFDYGEQRFQTLGMLGDRIVMVVWTQRPHARHIITMWKANEREQQRYHAQVGQ